jgi:hypothetical protein
MPSEVEYVYWPDFSCADGYTEQDIREEMGYMIERQLGPYSSGIRSSNWERVDQPPRQVIYDRIRQLEREINTAIREIYEHQESIYGTGN